MNDPRPIVVFDGVCRICNAWVDLILRHDKACRLRLASMQSPAGQLLLERYGYSPENLPTLLLVENSVLYTHTEAIFRVIRHLGWPLRLLNAMRIVPRALRDPAYRWFARHRYRLFGRRASCRIPNAGMEERFVERIEEL